MPNVRRVLILNKARSCLIGRTPVNRSILMSGVLYLSSFLPIGVLYKCGAKKPLYSYSIFTYKCH